MAKEINEEVEQGTYPPITSTERASLDFITRSRMERLRKSRLAKRRWRN